MIEARFKLLTETAKLPIFAKGNKASVGIDLFSDENMIIPAGRSRVIKTGLAWEPVISKKGYWNPFTRLLISFMEKTHKIEMQIRSRSGLSTSYSIEVGAGTIDEDYRGDIAIHLYNHGTESFTVRKGDRIAQGIIDVKPKVEITEIYDLSTTIRGDKGFGSTGI